MSHWLAPPKHIIIHQLLEEKGEGQGEKGSISGSEKGRDLEGEREKEETNEIACALERNRGQVTASAQLCTSY